MMKLDKATVGAIVAVVALSILASEPAMAQVAGGGGSGALTSVYTWFMTNVWAGLTLLGVVCVGLLFWLGRAAIYVIAMGAVGGLVVKFAPDIAAFFA